MLIICSKCKTQGVVDNSKLHDNGRTVNCNKCNYTFVVMTEYIDISEITYEVGRHLKSISNYSKDNLYDEVNRVIVDKCNALERTKHNCLEIFYKRAEAYYGLGIYDLALRDLEKGIILQPRFAKLYNLAGELYFKIGDHGKAIENLNVSASLDLYNIDPMINRARVYIKLGKYELAKQDIDRILRLDPQSQAALLLRFTVNLFICNRESTCSDASVMVVNLLDMVNKLESNTDV